jgi:hypothetical protein
MKIKKKERIQIESVTPIQFEDEPAVYANFYRSLGCLGVYIAVTPKLSDLEPYITRVFHSCPKDVTDPLSTAVGYTLWLDKTNILIWVSSLVPLNPRDGRYSFSGIAAHECTHLVVAAANFISAHGVDKAEEPLAYLAGDVASALWHLRRKDDKALNAQYFFKETNNEKSKH